MPRLSEIGDAASRQAALRSRSSRPKFHVQLEPHQRFSTSLAVGATAPIAILASTYLLSSTMATPAPATAISISVLGINLRYASFFARWCGHRHAKQKFWLRKRISPYPYHKIFYRKLTTTFFVRNITNCPQLLLGRNTVSCWRRITKISHIVALP